jgi:hypothetical protein
VSRILKGEEALGSRNARERRREAGRGDFVDCVREKRIGEPRALAIVVGERETRKRRCAKLVM